MELKQAAALFSQAQRSAWRDNSTIEITAEFVTIKVDVGTEVEAVSIVITAHRDDLSACVEVLSGSATDSTRRDRIHSAHTLAKLGGALVQAGNLVDQANALAGGSGVVA